jgi:hypothetical protein
VRHVHWRCVLALASVWAAPAWAEEPAAEAPAAKATDEPPFLRLSRDEAGRSVALETSIVRYAPAAGAPEGLAVDLVAALHVGEKDYYAQLNELFAEYDVLLYELVAPEGTEVPAGGGEERSGISSIQGGIQDLLGLEFQLEQVDYQRDNFIHADMSPDEMAASMKARGETLWVLVFRLLGQSILQDARTQTKEGEEAEPPISPLELFFAPDRELRLKRLLAEQFEDMDVAMIALEGEEGSTLITERNKVALQVLREQIDAGKRKIGVFYGAGHMPDMHRRLRDDFGLVAGEPRWLVAWDLKGAEEEEADDGDEESRSTDDPLGDLQP